MAGYTHNTDCGFDYEHREILNTRNGVTASLFHVVLFRIVFEHRNSYEKQHAVVLLIAIEFREV